MRADSAFCRLNIIDLSLVERVSNFDTVEVVRRAKPAWPESLLYNTS